MADDVVKALRKLPAATRKMLQLACDGDWDRVTLEADGSFKVHNRAPATRPVRAHVALTWQPPGETPAVVDLRDPCCGRCAGKHHVEDCPEPYRAPGVPKQKMRTVKLEELQVALGAPPATGGTTIVSAPARTRTSASVWVEPEAGAPSFDWDSVDLQDSAYRFRELYAAGLPAGVGFSYLPDVVALYGLDEDMTEAILRHPERVEVRPESFARGKGYPVLGFHRGDATVVLGLREPTRPCIIAVYMSSRLESDTHHVNHHGGGAGGKAEGGMPKNPGALMTKLRAWGCAVEPDGERKAAAVTYKGCDLGKVRIDRMMTRAEVEHEWQRMQRRIGGVDKNAS